MSGIPVCVCTLPVDAAGAIQADEGRWPRIYARSCAQALLAARCADVL